MFRSFKKVSEPAISSLPPLTQFPFPCPSFRNTSNKHIFSLEQHEYNSEGLNSVDINYQDNGKCLDLIERESDPRWGKDTIQPPIFFFIFAQDVHLSLKTGVYITKVTW